MGRLTESICVRLTKDEYEFIEMIHKKTGLEQSEAVRLALNMFRIILGLEAVDVEKVSKALREAAVKAIEDAKEGRVEWQEVDQLIEEKSIIERILRSSGKSSRRKG
jgi:hypothetical protein